MTIRLRKLPDTTALREMRPLAEREAMPRLCKMLKDGVAHLACRELAAQVGRGGFA